MPRNIYCLLILCCTTALCTLGESEVPSIDPSALLEDPESRQLGLVGFTALGVLMFPILVSLGMASFVSHLPTVFKELASEFGIPATPPRNFLIFRRNFPEIMRKHYNLRYNPVLANLQRTAIKRYGRERVAKKLYADLMNIRM